MQPSSPPELGHVARPRVCGDVQAVGFLVIHQKQKKTLDEIMNDLCPVLSVQQLYRIATMYWDHKFGTETVAQVRSRCLQRPRARLTFSPASAGAGRAGQDEAADDGEPDGSVTQLPAGR